MTSSENLVVVITGASSGIGRATAHAFARKGASVVLAARREHPLGEVALECEQLGAPRALIAPVDVGHEASVRELARRTVEELGRIDVWVNNAGVTAIGKVEETPVEVERRVIETNLLGTIYGSRAAVTHLRERGKGVLINVASLFGKAAAPYWAVYTASKFGVRGFTEALRQELQDAKDVHVCCVLPAAIDTPLYQHAANYTTKAIQPLRPLYDAEDVAEAIVRCVEKPEREVIVGGAGHAFSLFRKLLPALYDRVILRTVETEQLQEADEAPHPGNVVRPMRRGTGVTGGWKHPAPPRTMRRVAIAAGLLAAVPLALFARRRAKGT
jgi:short-subunit dehydrogenase